MQYVTYNEKDRMIDIRDEQTAKSTYPYGISIDEINTPEELIFWIHHISQKAWITQEHICQFIECVQKEGL